MSYVDVYAETVVISTFDDRDILDKAIYLTGNVHDNSVVKIRVKGDIRSCHAKYVYSNCLHFKDKFQQ